MIDHLQSFNLLITATTRIFPVVLHRAVWSKLMQCHVLLWSATRNNVTLERSFNPYFTALKYVCINHGDQRVFLIWNYHKCLSYFFRFIWIPKLSWLWVYYHYNILILSVRGPSSDVGVWRLMTVPALKGLMKRRSALLFDMSSE